MNAGGNQEELSELSRLTVGSRAAWQPGYTTNYGLAQKKERYSRTLDQYLKHHIPDAEHRIYAAGQKDFILRHNLLYLRVTPKRSNEDVLVFVVPGLKYQAVIDGCHRYLGHQGRDHMLSLLKERFWWLGMAQRMMMSVRNCLKCRIFEAKPQIPPMEPIL